MSCHSILGEVAAKRKQLEEADGHFANALEMAKQSGLPMLEVVVAHPSARAHVPGSEQSPLLCLQCHLELLWVASLHPL